MDAIISLAKKYEIAVIEDNAHGIFGRYRGKQLGTFGSMATLSFHETKNLTCGEGGALVVNEESLLERAEVIRDKGTNRKRFLRGQVDKYTWADVGSSYGLSDILAAYLCAQLREARGNTAEPESKYGSNTALVSTTGPQLTMCNFHPCQLIVTRLTICSISFAVVGDRQRTYRALEISWHSERVSLSAITPFRNGKALRRTNLGNARFARMSAIVCFAFHSTIHFRRQNKMM